VHDQVPARLALELGGRLVKMTGDGILAAFDGPGQVIPLRRRFRP
jgi:class 3 adenylate cyclase